MPWLAIKVSHFFHWCDPFLSFFLVFKSNYCHYPKNSPSPSPRGIPPLPLRKKYNASLYIMGIFYPLHDIFPYMDNATLQPAEYLTLHMILTRKSREDPVDFLWKSLKAQISDFVYIAWSFCSQNWSKCRYTSEEMEVILFQSSNIFGLDSLWEFVHDERGHLRSTGWSVVSAHSLEGIPLS